MDLKMNRLFICGMLAVLVSLGMVSAFGVSSPYWTDNPLRAYPGMDKVVMLNLQNGAGADADVVASLEVIAGKDVASLEKSEYLIPKGERVDVPLRIVVPSDAVSGSKYQVKVDVKSLGNNQGGMVSLSSGMLVVFDVVVGERPADEKEESPVKVSVYAWCAIIILAVLIIIILLKRKPARKSRRR